MALRLKSIFALKPLRPVRSFSSESVSNPRQLYKHLVRETRKLPEDAAKFYKDSIRRGFSQHADETDPERVKQIIDRAVEDAKWVVDKVSEFIRNLKIFHRGNLFVSQCPSYLEVFNSTLYIRQSHNPLPTGFFASIFAFPIENVFTFVI